MAILETQRKYRTSVHGEEPKDLSYQSQKYKITEVRSMAKIGMIGAGSWGTALALVLHNNGHEVTIWSIHEG